MEDIVGGPLVDNTSNKDPVPVLPPAPTDWFSEITNEILDLTGQLASVALFGSIGVGKSFVAHAVLDDDRTKTKFGENRYFLCCDDLTNSLDGFFERISNAFHTTPTQLESCLRSSPPLILVFDGVDCVLDSLIPEADEICAMIEEFGRLEHICLVTTSRMYANIHGFHRVEVPTPPEGHVRDVFYNLSNLARSPGVDTLIAKLDFHLFSIELIARTIRENSWDEEMLVKAWDDHTSALRTNYYQRLKDTIEPVFRSPRIKELGTSARDVLGAIASFRSGIGEHQLEGIFHGIGGVRAVVDELCRFSLVHRKDGVLTMLSPLKFYFLESMIVHAETGEVIRWGPDCMAAPGGMSFWLDLFLGYRVTIPSFEVLPVFTQGPPVYLLSPASDSSIDQDAGCGTLRPCMSFSSRLFHGHGVTPSKVRLCPPTNPQVAAHPRRPNAPKLLEEGTGLEGCRKS